MAGIGHGMQVVKVMTDHSYQLDEGLLQQILLKPEIKDLPVVVVSVAGAYRGGKSFLLNFFIRYLSATQAARSDGSWLGENSAPLVGFNWRGGVERNTTGILLWSDPFVTTLASGEKVAVLLMDTQGTFDSKSTIRDNSTIFALSTLISSVQIYNLSMNIQEDDLQHLQLFTMYGKMVQEKNHAGKAFQTLEFLVRDWPYYFDYAYGAEGGKRFLEEKLAITPDQPKELRDLRTHINDCFKKVLCFLMPHPGFQVQNPKFNGNISEIDANFRIHLKQLVSSLLSNENLTPKMINGQKVKAGDLFNYFKAYMHLFNSDQIPSPRTIMQATVEAGLLSAMNEARAAYEKGMNADCGPSQSAVAPSDVADLHQKNVTAAQTAFNSKRTMASPEENKKNLDNLTKELNVRLPQFEQSNLSKLQTVMKLATDAYEQIIRDVSKGQPLCLHPADLNTIQNEAVQAATKYYDGHVKKVSQKPDQKRVELLHNLQQHNAQLITTNDRNNQNVVNELKTEYFTFMETKSVHPPLSDAAFKGAHDGAYNQALNKFQAKRNRPSSHHSDGFKEELVRIINETFNRLNNINRGKIEQERVKQEQERIKQEQERIRQEQERNRLEQERIAKEQEMIRLQQEKERIEQERQRLELERQRLEQENQRRRHKKKKCSIQ